MKIHLIEKQTLLDFALQYPGSRMPLGDWTEKLKFADWDQPHHIKQTFSAADLLGRSSDRVVFDIGGNNYRMICKYVFGTVQVHFICLLDRHPCRL